MRSPSLLLLLALVLLPPEGLVTTHRRLHFRCWFVLLVIGTAEGGVE